MPSTAWKRSGHGEKWYAGETISVSIGQGQVSVTPISLAVMMATVANGGTRMTPHLLKAVDDGAGMEAGAAASAASRRQTEARDAVEAVRAGPVAGGQRGGHGRPRAHRGTRRRRQDRHRAGDLDPGPETARAAPRRTCAITAGSCSSRRARTPRLPASSSPSTPSTAIWRRRSPSTSCRPTSRRRRAGRCRHGRSRRQQRLPTAVAAPAAAGVRQPDDGARDRRGRALLHRTRNGA